MENRPSVFYTEIPLGEEKLVARLAMSDMTSRHEWSAARHTTQDYELHLILGGEADFSIAGEDHLLQKGSAILIAPDVPHSGYRRPGDFDRFFPPSQRVGKTVAAKPAAVRQFSRLFFGYEGYVAAGQ